MFFQPAAIFYSLIFYLGLEFVIYAPTVAFYGSVILFIFSVWIAKRIGKRWAYSAIPGAIALPSSALLYFIDVNIEKQIFVFLSASMYYLALLSSYRLRDFLEDKTAQGVLSASAMTAAFFFYTASYGVNLNFYVPVWLFVILFLAPTILVSYEYFIIISRNRKKTVIYSILLGMAMAEVALVINFWPFGYLTTGVIALIFYYILWDLTRSYFLDILSKKKVLFNMIFFTILIAGILLSSNWLPEV